jgi:hypothetical protein
VATADSSTADRVIDRGYLRSRLPRRCALGSWSLCLGAGRRLTTLSVQALQQLLDLDCAIHERESDEQSLDEELLLTALPEPRLELADDAEHAQ